MAGDWLKVEKDTPEKPEVLAIAARLGIDPEIAFTKCFKVWRWADSHTPDGNARSVTPALLDALVHTAGFADALLDVGWLVARNGSLQFPNFDRHMGQSGKKRALTAQRVKGHRNAKCNAPSVTKALPEKRREEKSKGKNPLNPSCPEPAPPPSEQTSGPPVLVYPTVGKQATWELPQSKVEEYRKNYPDLDIMAELRKALQWCIDNRPKRKTADGMPRFLCSWLNGAQNKGRANGQGSTRSKLDVNHEIVFGPQEDDGGG